MLSDKIDQIKEIGIAESDTNIQLLLSKFGFNVERAIGHYFEHGMSNLPMANPFASNKDRLVKNLHGAKPVSLTATVIPVVNNSSWHSTEFTRSITTGRSSSFLLNEQTQDSIKTETTIQKPALNVDTKVEVSRSLTVPMLKPTFTTILKSHNNFKSNNSKELTASESTPITPSYVCSDLIGRRIVSGYSISSGYVVRTQSLRFTIENDTSALSRKEIKKSKSSVTLNSNGMSGSGSSNGGIANRKSFSGSAGGGTKDKFSAGKLFFDTYHDLGAGPLLDQQRDVRGRLSNGLCDFLVPLLRAGLVELRGHIAYDYGQVGTFQDIPVSLHIYVSPTFMDMTTAGVAANLPSLPRELQEAANDLLIWLTEGETAVALLRQQRAKELAAKLGVATVSASNKSESISVVESRRISSLNTAEESVLDTDRAARSFDAEVICIEGEAGAESEEEMTMCVDEFLSHEAALNGMPLATQPSALAKDLTMKGYQLQALHWMRQREEVVVAVGDGVSSDNMLLCNSNNSTLAAVDADCEVVFCEPPRTSDLSLPHEGLLRFPAGWGSAQKESNPLWMPIVSYHNKHNVCGASPQTVHTAVASLQVNDCALLPSSGDQDVSIFWWNRYSQRIQRAAPLAPRPCRGGILAHEMGMGKTIMTIALIAADKEQSEEKTVGMIEREGMEEKVSVLALVTCEDLGENGVSLEVVSEGGGISIAADDERVTCESAIFSCSSVELVSAHRRSSRRRVMVCDDDDEKEKTVVLIVDDEEEEGPVVSTTSDEEEDREVLQDTSSSDEYSDNEKNRRTRSTNKKRKRVVVSKRTPINRNKSVSRRVTPEVVDLVGSDEEVNDEVQPVSTRAAVRKAVNPPSRSEKTALLFQTNKQKSSTALNTPTVPPSTRGGTLIVCPMTLMAQWVEEVRTKTDGALSVYMYYGADRRQESLARHDVVVTSYGMLVSEAKNRAAQKERVDRSALFATSKNSNRGLLDMSWRRVVLDEAHTIKNCATEVARACYSVVAECRWALTGTPIQNSLDDLHSLVRFLHHEPWNQVRWWRKVISEPHATGDPRGISVLRGVLAELMLRRTKTDRDTDGRSIIELPGKICHIVHVSLSDAEREFYATLMSRSQAVCRGYEKDLTRRKNRYAALFTLLLRLRQTCDHAFLAIGKSSEEDEEVQVVTKVVTKVTSSSSAVVSIDADIDTTVTDEMTTKDFEVTDSEDPGVLGPTFLKSIYNKLAQSLRASHTSSSELVLMDVSPGNDICSSSASATRSDSGFLQEVMQSLRDLSSSSTTADVDAEDGSAESETLTNSKPFECPICYEDTAVLAACITTCGHILCLQCAQSTVRQNGSCPLCMTRLAAEDILPLSGRDQASYTTANSSTGDSTSNSSNSARNGFVFSTRRNYAIQTAFARAVDNNNAARQSRATSTIESGAEVLAALPMNPLVAMMNRREGQAGAWRHWGDKRVVTAAGGVEGEGGEGLQYQGLPWHSSSKLAALTNMLDRIFRGLSVKLEQNTITTSDKVEMVGDAASASSEGGRGVKVVVFSQWTGMLDLVEFSLRQRSATDRISYRRLDGKMTQAARTASVNSFNQDDDVRLFLISLKAGGVGLNLTSASVVILLDPWWNPGTEDQAIDRIHRLGQTREVRVYRLICRDTVEERLLLLQDRKRSLSQKAIGKEGAQSVEARLSLEDLKGFFV